MKYEPSKNSDPTFEPKYNKIVRCGYCTEITSLSWIPKPDAVIKIDKNHYVVNDGTGEIHEYSKSENRSESVESIRKSLARLRNIINCNSSYFMKWVTLTYAENMQDEKQLYSDFDKFSKRFKYLCKKNDWETPEYICVAEPQGRGAWHLHIIYLYSRAPPYIDNNTVLYPMWGHGFTNIKNVDNGIDNLGAYFTAYLADIPVGEFEGPVLSDGTKEIDGKKYVKGGRLHFYPPYFNLYRTSRGVKKPVVKKICDTKELQLQIDLSGQETFSYSKTIDFRDKDGFVVDVGTYSKRYYNKKRRKII